MNWTKIILLLFYLGFGITFNIIGVISISELYLLTYSFIYLNRLPLNSSTPLKIIVRLYAFLFVAQVFSEIIVQNTVSNSLKGLAVTVISFLHSMFLIYMLKDNFKLIIYLLISSLLFQIIFSSSLEITDETIGNVTYVKFYLAPILMSLLLIMSVVLKNASFRNAIPNLFILLGLFLMILGARSSGLMTLLTGAFALLLGRIEKINVVKLSMILVIAIIIFIPLYKVYVDKVITGEWGGKGNKEQLMRTENPYNPINLLMSGRSETFVGYVAWQDKFWFGHGSWANDKTGKYHIMVAKMHAEDSHKNILNKYSYIPTHSVLLGYAALNGFFAFIAILSLMLYIYKIGLLGLDSKSRYFYVHISYIISSIWVFLFSPISHFRITLPLTIALCYIMYIRKNSNEIAEN